MKHFLTILAIVLLSELSFAQNLVANGGFEQYTSCPTGGAQMYKCTGWNAATVGNSDYFNTCSTSPSFSVPDNFFGSQGSEQGDGYAGLYAFMPINDWRGAEYITTSITDLVPGTTYRVSMSLSLAGHSGWAVDGMAVFFYRDGIGVDTVTTNRLNVVPQIKFDNYGILNDTLNWVQVIDSFVADSAYKNIIIGVFQDTSDFHYQENIPGILNAFAYYYIDDVTITAIATGTHVNSQSISNLRLYPNPLTTYSTLSFSNPLKKAHHLSIYNIDGRLVQQTKNVRTDNIRIEGNHLVPGCYFYELKNEDGAVGKGKLFVQ